jgi:hypothetical protein
MPCLQHPFSGEGLAETSCPPALSAYQAATFDDGDFCFRCNALRVVAPGAGERAALHEHGCPDTWTVMEAILLDVEHHTALHIDAVAE